LEKNVKIAEDFMNILFVKTSIGSWIESTVDLGVASISANLKKNGYKVNYFLVDNWESLKQLFFRIDNFNPEVVCFSSYESTCKSINKLISIIKKKYPKKIIICGGVHIILSPENYIKNKNIDAVCLGEGEYVLVDFLNKLSRNDDYKQTIGFWVRDGDLIIKNKRAKTIENIDKLPDPDREIFYNEGLLYNPAVGEGIKKTIEFIFSRGCIYNCSYCSNHALKAVYGKNYVRFRSPKKAIKEITTVLNKYEADYLVFHDDSFTVNKKWMNEFLDIYKKNINIPFRCNARADLCNENVFKSLKEANCDCVQFGLESGDSDMRENLLDRHMSDMAIINAFNLAKKNGLRTGAFVMIGLPKETPEKFKKTIELVARINADKYYLYVFRPYQSTKLYNYCKKNKMIQPQNGNFIEWHDSILKIPGFQKKDIKYYYSNFNQLVVVCQKYLNSQNYKFIRKLIFDLYCIPPSNSLLFHFLRILFFIFGK